MERNASVWVFVGLLICAVSAGADIDMKVHKKQIFVYPPDASGMLTVSGGPSTVLGAFPITILCRNKETDMTVQGQVLPNGAFVIRVMGGYDDDLKITFYDSAGNKKSVKLEAPEAGHVAPYPPPPVPALPPPVEERVIVDQEEVIGGWESPLRDVPPLPPE